MRATLALFFLLLCSCVPALLSAQDSGYAIRVEIEGYADSSLALANNLLDKQFLVDTAYRAADGSYTFRNDSTPLAPGIYLAVLSPENNYFQLLVSRDDQHFTLRTSVDELDRVSVENSAENELFYDYLDFMAEQQTAAGPLRESLADSTLSDKQRDKLSAELAKLDERVTQRQERTVAKHPNSFVAAIINATSPQTPPDFADLTDEDERMTARWRWLQQHYFDRVNLGDERLLRTPFLYGIVERYVSELHVQDPDTLARAIDNVLARTDPDGEVFKYYLVHFVNGAARSKVVGMDALYVYLMDNYYLKGRAPWASEEQIAKFRDNVDRLRPLLIGKTAPDITVYRRDNTPVNLSDVGTKYTVLYFWRYDCGTCKKNTPKMKAFLDEWGDRGVTLFSVCVKGEKDIPGCWEYVDEHELGDWLNGVDPYQRFYRAYDVRATPSVFVLDADRKIISKRLGADQLGEFLTAYEKQQAAAGSK